MRRTPGGTGVPSSWRYFLTISVQSRPPETRLRYSRVSEEIKVDAASNLKTSEGGGVIVEPSAPPLAGTEPSCVGLTASGGEESSEDR